MVNAWAESFTPTELGDYNTFPDLVLALQDATGDPRPAAQRRKDRLPPRATRCHARHGTGGRHARDSPHRKTDGRQETGHHPTRLGATCSGIRARAREEEEEELSGDEWK